jgi:hypothetical protein
MGSIFAKQLQKGGGFIAVFKFFGFSKEIASS